MMSDMSENTKLNIETKAKAGHRPALRGALHNCVPPGYDLLSRATDQKQTTLKP